MAEFCHSCAAPLTIPEFKGSAEDYCSYCTDDQGNLKTREEIVEGVARWFMSWQRGVDQATAAARAERYVRAMPAWAE